MKFKVLIWIIAISLLSINLCSALEERLEISHYNDMLELREPIGKVRETITIVEMPELLKSGIISTYQGTTEYDQYLRFYETTEPLNKTFVDFTEAIGGLKDDKVSDFLFVSGIHIPNKPEGAFFEYEIEFESGLRSMVDNYRLLDMHGKIVNILGAEYTILDSSVEPWYGEIGLTLVSGKAKDSLYEGDKKLYNIEGELYNVEVLNVDSTNIPHTATFDINGHITNALIVGDFEILNNGKMFVVTDMNALIDRVSFALDASLVELIDDGYNDTEFYPNVRINNENIEEGYIKIKGDYLPGPPWGIFEITGIEYRLTPDPAYGGRDVWVDGGEGIRELLNLPEAMLGANWDIKYEGLTDVFTTPIKFDPQGTNSYNLIFENQQSLTYNFPFTTNEGNTFKYGEETKDLVFKEGFIDINAQHASEQDFTIGVVDSFVLTYMPADNDAISHVVRYEGFNPIDKVLTFRDLSNNTIKQVTYTSTSIPGTIGYGDLVMGGTVYKFYIANTSSNLPPLAIDLNGDGLIDSSEVRITTKGGSILDLGNHHESIGGLWIGSQGNNGTWDNWHTYPIQNNIEVELRTRAEDFEEGFPPSIGGGYLDEYTLFQIENRTNESIGVINQISSNGGIGKQLNKDEVNEDYSYGMTDYGALFTLWDYSELEIPETLTIAYPLQQIDAHVFITHEIVNATIPDLTILNMNYFPLNLEVGDLVTVNVTVANLGNAPVGNFDWVYDFDYAPGKDSRGLNTGENMTIQLTNIYTEPGDYVFYFELDPLNKIDEISEFNNNGTMNIFVNGDIDLVPTLKYVRQNFVNPKEVTFAFEINNYGNLWAEDVFYNINFGDNSGTGGLISEKIYPNEPHTIKINHEYLDFGEYYVVFEVDPQNTIEETNENNNLIETFIQVRKLTVDGNKFITNTTKDGPFGGVNPV
jgi:hypothetical protein